MSIPPIGDPEFGRFIAALEDAGFTVVDSGGEAPLRVEVHDEQEDQDLRIAVYMWPIRDAGQRAGGERRRVGLHRRHNVEFNPERDEFTFLLGYDRDTDVYAGWSFEAYREAAPNASAWVPEEALRAARENGFALPASRRGEHEIVEPVVAFRPDYLRSYFERARTWRRLGTDPEELSVAPAMGTGLSRYTIGLDSEAGLFKEAIPEGVVEEVAADVASVAPLEAYEGEAPSVSDGEPATPEESPESKEVETGFAESESPKEGISKFSPLAPSRFYWFWFGVGTNTGGSIETAPTPLPVDGLPDCAQLVVKMFGFDGELSLEEPTRGVIQIDPDGAAKVVSRAATASMDDELHEKFLWFGVTTPEESGLFHLRCNVYYGSTLVQSRLVSCRVGGDVEPARPALASDLDYSISGTLALNRLANVPDHDLSLMVNGVGPAHQFRFYSIKGEKEFANDASVEAAAIETLIKGGRDALQQAAWGHPGEWVDGSDTFRYSAGNGEREQFKNDLERLAIRGRQIYIGVASELAGSVAEREELERIAARPGRVQIATAAAGLYVPAALFYDHPLEDAPAETTQYELCVDFQEALDGGKLLQDWTCLTQGCPSRDDLLTFCPSGFWGYRHEIGWPLSTRESLRDQTFREKAQLAIGVSLDLEDEEDHSEYVLSLGQGEIAKSRDDLTEVLKGTPPHLVYLYCHGGLTANDMPFVEVGPRGSDGITRNYLATQKIRWGPSPPRPVIFINGCHTTALDPGQVLNLVNGFVQESDAIGVIGTELTVFEPLACAFAQATLDGFLDGSRTIGGAVRHARLELLAKRNPMGLVYVPFVAPGLSLRRDREPARSTTSA